MSDDHKKILENINSQLKVCSDYLNQHDIKGFFINLRISAELICRYLIVSERKENEFKHVFLIELAKKFKGREQLPGFHAMALFLFEKKIVPNYIYYLLEFIRKTCNEPAHNVLSEEEEKYLLSPNRSSFNNLFYWFFNSYLNQNISDDIKDFLNNYQIEDSFSLFIISFKLNTAEFDFQSFYNQLDKSIWQVAVKNATLNDYFLFNHIDTLLRSNNEYDGFENIQPYSIVSFNLKDNSKDKKVNQLKTLFLNNKHIVDEIDIKFNFFTKTELCPVLHFIPGFPVFFISFGLSIEKKNNTLQKIIDFNYMLRNIEWNGVDIFTLKNQHPNARENNDYIEDLLDNELNMHFKSKHKLNVDNEFFAWNMSNFLDYLLVDFPVGSFDKILPDSYQIFTFVKSAEQIPNDRLSKLLTLISSIYNSNFYPTNEFISKNISLSQPFEQIYFASTNEGTIILQNDDKDYNIPFFEDFQSIVINRYLWVYKYTFFQKILLLVGIDNLNKSFKRYDNDVNDSLHTIYQILSICDSENISNTTSINHFYSVIRNGMSINKLYNQLSQRWRA